MSMLQVGFVMAIKKQADDFQNYVLEQLDRLPELTCKRMFGGHGLYQGIYFFGILNQGRLYFKTDAESRAAYEAYGMKPFQPKEKVVLKNYYEVPVEILEDATTLTQWAKRAVKVSQAS